MNICFINSSIYGINGIARVMSTLSSELVKRHKVTIVTFEDESKVNRRQHGLAGDVEVIFKGDPHKHYIFRRALHKVNQNCDFLKTMGRGRVLEWIYYPEKERRIWRDFINERDFDVVVGVQAHNACLLGSINSTVRSKCYGWQHNSYSAYLETKGAYYWNQKELFSKYLRLLDGYVVLNSHDKKLYESELGLDVFSISNPRSYVSHEKSSLDSKRFVAAGSLRKAKGFDLLIDSFCRYADKGGTWSLEIYGEGEEKSNLIRLIESRGIGSRIAMPGSVNNLKDKMLNASAYLLSSRWEGMPMVVLEALELGLPVVSFDIASIAPLVENEKEGLVAKHFDTDEFADKMLRIEQDEQFRHDMGRNASAKANQFDVGIIAGQWECLFESGRV